MRIFSGLIEAYHEIERDLLEVGEWVKGFSVQDKIVKDDPNFDFMEMRPYTYCLTRWFDDGDYIDHLNLNKDWLHSEFLERINKTPVNPGKAWLKREKTWSQFVQANGRFSYTYNERFHLGDQFRRVLRELRLNPNTRQAVIAVFNPIIDMEKLGGFQRVPCSLTYQFLLRNNELELIYSMRSCDFYEHFPYDQLLALMLLSLFARILGVEANRFTHLIGSLHAFRKDFGEEVF